MFPLFKYQVCTIQYRSWLPECVPSHETTIVMLPWAYWRDSKFILISVWTSLINCRYEPICHSLLIDCSNKNHMGNSVQSESLQCIVIPSDILRTYVSLISKFIHNNFDIS